MPVSTTYRHPKAISFHSPRWLVDSCKQFKFNQVHNIMNRANWLLPLALLTLLSVGACQKPDQPKPDPEQAISIPTQSQAVFNNGISFPTPSGQSQTQPQTQTVTFKATESWTTSITDTKSSTWLTVEPSSGGAGTVNMTVTAQPNNTDKERTATVTIKSGSATKSFTVTQAAKPAEPIAVTSVELNKTELALTEGASETLVATVKPDDAADKTVIWSSSDEAVATVDNGKVTGIKEGTATITAKAGEKSATCTVTVSKNVVAVTEVTLNKTELSLKEGESETLTANVKPDDATDKTVTWSTSDANIATVENGKVTAVKEGTATITAKAGEKSATCKVTVSKNVIAVTEVTLNKTELSLKEGESETLTATVKPDDATDKTVTWSTSDASIATVENGKVTAVKEGTATITAKAGEKSATCTVTVSKNVVAVTEVALNKTELNLKEGESETLTATVKPDDATDKTVTWSTSDVNIATVDNGKVTAVKEGTATITAKAGEKSATCKVTVSKNVVAVTEVTLNKTELSLKEGESETLTANVKPDDATDKTVTWSTSDANIATVENGKVTAVKEGTATITAKAGEKSATCKVTVSKNVIAVAEVTLNKTELSLKEGESETLTATVKPDDATDKNVTWSTSDANVATVDNGKVTAVKAGSVTITAKAGDVSASCVVTVTGVSITVSPASLSFLASGGTKTIQITCNGDWSVSGTPDWCTLSSTTGSGNATVQLTASANSNAQRTAQLTFTCSGRTATVAVMQTGGGWQNMRFVHRSLYMMFTSVHCGYSATMNEKIHEQDAVIGDKYHRVDVYGRGADNSMGESILNFIDAPKLENLLWFATPCGIFDYRKQIYNVTDRTWFSDMLLTAINEQIEYYPPVTGAAFKSSISGKVLSIQGKIYSHEAETFKLTVYLLEDNVTDEYSVSHNDVLRISFTDALGDSFTIGTKNSTHDFQYSIALPDEYKTKDLSILVIVQRQYGSQQTGREIYTMDYYVDNCRKARVGEEAKLEFNGYLGGGGNEGIGIDDSISF